VAEELSAEQSAKLIMERGPLTKKEVRTLSNDKTLEYFQLMSHFLRELGADAFLERREELREAALRKIVNRASVPHGQG
jgi:hypothetical protein